jgi:hypothetical protein
MALACHTRAWHPWTHSTQSARTHADPAKTDEQEALAMQPLHDVAWRTVAWALPAGMTWELRAGEQGEQLVARLRMTSSNILAAEAEAPEGQWRLTLTGLIARKLTVYDAAVPGGLPLLEAHRNLRHSWTVPQADGLTLRWQAAGLSSPDWVCSDQDRRPLITLHLIPGPLRPASSSDIDVTGRVLLQDAARAVPRLSLAVVIGWYLLVVNRMEAGAFGEASG